MLDGVVAHEVTELGSFLEHFRRKALKRAVVGSLAKPLQFHELAHVHKLAEENDIRTLIFRVHDILDNDDSPGTERHNRQNAQNHKRRDIGLRKHLE